MNVESIRYKKKKQHKECKYSHTVMRWKIRSCNYEMALMISHCIYIVVMSVYLWSFSLCSIKCWTFLCNKWKWRCHISKHRVVLYSYAKITIRRSTTSQSALHSYYTLPANHKNNVLIRSIDNQESRTTLGANSHF